MAGETSQTRAGKEEKVSGGVPPGTVSLGSGARTDLGAPRERHPRGRGLPPPSRPAPSVAPCPPVSIRNRPRVLKPPGRDGRASLNVASTTSKPIPAGLSLLHVRTPGVGDRTPARPRARLTSSRATETQQNMSACVCSVAAPSPRARAARPRASGAKGVVVARGREQVSGPARLAARCPPLRSAPPSPRPPAAAPASSPLPPPTTKSRCVFPHPSPPAPPPRRSPMVAEKMVFLGCGSPRKWI